MGALRAVLLDFGGTLDSDGVHWSTIYAGAFESVGLQLERRTLDRAFMDSERALEQLPRVAELGLEQHVSWQVAEMLRTLNRDSVLVVNPPTVGVEDSPPESEDQRLQRLAQQITAAVLRPVQQRLALSRRTLGQARAAFSLALISNFTENLKKILVEAQLDSLFERIYCSATEGIRKPNPAIFLRALEQLGVPPQEAAMVGDSLTNDIMPAKELGITTLWIRGDRVFGKGDEAAADHVVQDVEQALSICRQMAGIRAPRGPG